MAQSVKPTSIRLSPVTDELIRAEAKRTKRSRSEVLRSAVDEGLRMRAFPGIGFKGEGAHRRAYLMGYGASVWMTIDAYQDFNRSAERMAEETGMDEDMIRLAVAYYERFPEEIDEAIAENDRMAEEYADRFPRFEVPPE